MTSIIMDKQGNTNRDNLIEFIIQNEIYLISFSQK